MLNSTEQAEGAVPSIIWTAAGIGREIKCSPSFVRNTLAIMPGSPVNRMGRRYWAFADELTAFFEQMAHRKLN